MPLVAHGPSMQLDAPSFEEPCARLWSLVQQGRLHPGVACSPADLEALADLLAAWEELHGLRPCLWCGVTTTHLPARDLSGPWACLRCWQPPVRPSRWAFLGRLGRRCAYCGWFLSPRHDAILCWTCYEAGRDDDDDEL